MLRTISIAISFSLIISCMGCSQSSAPPEPATEPPSPPPQSQERLKLKDPAPPLFTPKPAYAPPPMFDPSPIFNPQPLEKDLPLFVPPPIQIASAHKVQKSNKGGKPLKLEKKKVKGIPLYEMVVDLDDPQTYITVGLPHDAAEANSATVTHGDEDFRSFAKRYNAALLVNGTFFSKDEQKRVMGNIVREAKFIKYSPWENYGTTLGIKENNELEMVTARLEGKPNWTDYWFSITCGPRVLRNGKVEIDAAVEGFQDSHVLTIGPRCAIGFNRKKRQIIYACFLNGLSLEKEGEMMKALGCDEAMNLDGGASRAVASGGKIVITPGRPLTNILVVYDSSHKAPPAVRNSWDRFQEGERATPPL